MVAAIAVALAAIVVAVLLELERRGRVELEWNPFSDASHAARAERAGALAEALWYFERAGQSTQVIACLQRSLPESPLRVALIEAIAELLDLQDGLAMLGTMATLDLGPVPEHVASFVQDMAATLRQTAERVAVASVLWEAPDGLPSTSQQAIGRLNEVRGAIRRVRDELGGLVVAGQDPGGLEMTLSRSTALADSLRVPTGSYR